MEYKIKALSIATEKEMYAIKNGIATEKYIDGILHIVFHSLFDGVHKSVIIYNCKDNCFVK